MVEADKSYIILLIKNFNTVYTYFHLSKSIIEEFDTQHGKFAWESSKPIIKVFFIENGVSIEKDCIILDPLANNWYITIPEEDKDIFIEYGRLLRDNKYESILHSNMVTTPRNHPSTDLNLYFIDINLEQPGTTYPKTSNTMVRKRKPLKYPKINITNKIIDNPIMHKYLKEVNIKNVSTSR